MDGRKGGGGGGGIDAAQASWEKEGRGKIDVVPRQERRREEEEEEEEKDGQRRKRQQWTAGRKISPEFGQQQQQKLSFWSFFFETCRLSATFTYTNLTTISIFWGGDRYYNKRVQNKMWVITAPNVAFATRSLGSTSSPPPPPPSLGMPPGRKTDGCPFSSSSPFCLLHLSVVLRGEEEEGIEKRFGKKEARADEACSLA